MQTRFISLMAVAVALLGAACTPSDRSVEYPYIESSNTMTIDISKVELSDTATVLVADAYYYPGE